MKYIKSLRLREFWLITLFFLLLTCAFSYKVFFGYIPLPTDLIVGTYHPWYGKGYEGYPAGIPVKNPKLSDAVSIFYPLKELAVNNIKSGEFPLWNPYMFAGYPLFANVQLGLLFPTMIFYIFPMPAGWTLQTLSQPFLAGVFMYLLLRYLKLDIFAATFGGIAFGFGGFTIMWMQWNTQATTAMILPILILVEDKYLKLKKVSWGILFSILICIQIFAGYLPVLVPTYFCLLIWFLFRSDNYIKDLRLGFFLILGVALSAVFVVPVTELVLNSQRSVESLGSQNPFTNPANFLTLVAPDFFGNDATGNFWGTGDHMDATLYIGIVSLILSIVGMRVFNKESVVRFAVTIFVLAVIFSVQNPLSEFLYKIGVWGGTSITMNRINFLMNFSVAMLAAFGISALKQNNFKFSYKIIFWIFAGIFGLLIGLYLCRYIIEGWYWAARGDALGEFDRTLANIRVAFKNLVLPLLITFSVLIGFIAFNFIKNLRRFIPIFFIIILIGELFRFGWKFNTFSEVRFAFPDSNLTQYLEKFPADRFVAESDILPANMWVPFKVSSIAGYDGLYPLRTAKLLAVANSDNVDADAQPRWGTVNVFGSGVLNASNTRFILAVKRKEEVFNSEGEVHYKLRGPELKEVFSDRFVAVLENQNSLPRAYLTPTVKIVSDKEMLAAMVDKNFPIRTISLTDDFSFSSKEATVSGNVKYKQISNSHVQLNSKSDRDSFLVVLDGFYPGWKAFIDNRETVIHRTNYDFKGIFLPKGQHYIDLVYRPDSIIYGGFISGVSLLTAVGLLFLDLRKRVS